MPEQNLKSHRYLQAILIKSKHSWLSLTCLDGYRLKCQQAYSDFRNKWSCLSAQGYNIQNLLLLPENSNRWLVVLTEHCNSSWISFGHWWEANQLKRISWMCFHQTYVCWRCFCCTQILTLCLWSTLLLLVLAYKFFWH